jgi:AraC-like DNA-binding protein
VQLVEEVVLHGCRGAARRRAASGAIAGKDSEAARGATHGNHRAAPRRPFFPSERDLAKGRSCGAPPCVAIRRYDRRALERARDDAGTETRYELARPIPALRPRVARIWQLESDAPVVPSPGRWAIPDGCSEWLFVLGDPLWRDVTRLGYGAHVCGLRQRALLSRPTGRLLIVGVTFAPGSAAAALPVSAHELAGRDAALDDLWSGGARALVQRLAECRDFEGRRALLEREIHARVGPMDQEVRAAVHRLAADPALSIARLAGGTAGARRLERKFRAHVGIPPKRLARIFRMQHALRAWREGHATRLADLAARAGYADQAHLAREFVALLGASPGSRAAHERQMSDSFKTPGGRGATILAP